MAYYTYKSKKIYYEELGDGTPLLLLHGNPAVTASIIEGREMSKKNPGAQQFYEYMNGADWESVVDADTRAMVAHTKNIVQFFHKPLNELKTDLLLTGSREDEFFPGDYYDTLFSNILNQVEQGKKHIFNHGGHPAMMSNQEEFIQLSNLFFVK